jgi:hypothetical protein
MAKLNLKALKVKISIADDKTVTVDVTTSIADLIYSQCAGIAAHALAFKIYKSTGPLELDDEEVRLIEEVANRLCTPRHIDAIMEQLKNKK